MSSRWKTTKSYSKTVAEYAAAPGAFVGGLIGKGGTVTTVATSTATVVEAGTVATTTTVTTAAAGFATAAAGVTLAAGAGTAAGQLINGGFSFFWDPEPIDTKLEAFEPVCDEDVIALLDDLFCDTCFAGPLVNLSLTHDSVLDAEKILPDLGASAANFAFLGVRILANTLRGAAFGTAKNKDQVRKAASVIKHDLDLYFAEMRKFAIALKAEPTLYSAFPTISLDSYRQFIADHANHGRDAIPPMEQALIDRIGNLAEVSFREPFDQRIARWVADGADEGEIAAFCNRPDQQLHTADILLESLVWCWADFDLDESDYL
jgi:hypothetical protein